jgi:hypothetical protein
MLFRNSTPKARFAGWAFVDLVAFFGAISLLRPVMGLAGLGAVLVLAAILVEANKDVIWQSYKKNYKKAKGPLKQFWSKPNDLYYQINVYVLWPVIFALGLASIYAAYLLGS